MSALTPLTLCTVKSQRQRRSSNSPQLPIVLRRFTSRKIIRPFINCNTMADFASRLSSVLPCHENGATTGAVLPKYAEIIVVRHGETEWNSIHRIQGKTEIGDFTRIIRPSPSCIWVLEIGHVLVVKGHLDVDLNDAGRQQAVAVADRLSREPKISAVYSSDLKRACETAGVIANNCGVHEVIKDPDLRERHLGDLQGVVYSEISKANPVAYKAFVSHQDDEEIPGGGESFNQVYKRCTSALQRIAKKHQGERVVVVSHGGTIRALHRRASPHRRASGKVLNTSVSVFHISDEDKWSIISWSDVSHLDQTGFLASGFGGDRNSG